MTDKRGMGRWFIGRLATLVPTIAVVIALSFFIVRLAPGSPFASEKAASPAVIAALEARFGLNEPLWVQLMAYAGRMVRGDLGPSLRYPQHDVNELFVLGVGPTATIAGLSLLWALAWGGLWALLGAWAQLCQRERVQRAVSLGIALGMGVPSFVLGPMLALGLAVGAGVLPAAGWGQLRHVVLPSVTLGSVLAAQVARLLQGGLQDALTQPFMRQALAKGLSPMQLLLRHALKPAVVPLLSYLPPTLSGLLVGSVAVERIFLVPGLGLLFVDAAFNRDYFVVMGIVVFESTLLLLLNALVDAAYALIDPRVRLGH